MRLYSDFIIHIKNNNNNNLFWSYLLLIAQLPIDLAPPQHLPFGNLLVRESVE